MSNQAPWKQYVQVPDPDPTAWPRIETARLRRRRRRWLAASAIVLVLAALGGASRLRRPALVPATGLFVNASERQTLRMSDGSIVEIDAGAVVEFAPSTDAEQLVTLSSGRVLLRVVHRPDRRFVVRAGYIEVVDLGTVFAVDRDRAAVTVRVDVTVGSVELHRTGASARTLRAGDSVTVPDEELVTAPLVTIPTVPVEAKVAPRPRAPTSEALFDPLAPVAAYELGTIRMDRLGDRAGALTALLQAVRQGPRMDFRTDADARIVQLYDELGRTAECRSARDAFSTAHPKDARRASVASRCSR